MSKKRKGGINNGNIKQDFYDDLERLGIDELVFNTCLCYEKIDKILKANPGVKSDDLLKYAREYTADYESRFLADVRSYRFKTEDEWMKYQTDLIDNALAYALRKVNEND